MLSGVARSTWAKAEKVSEFSTAAGAASCSTTPAVMGKETLSQGLCTPLRHIRWLGPSLEKGFV